MQEQPIKVGVPWILLSVFVNATFNGWIGGIAGGFVGVLFREVAGVPKDAFAFLYQAGTLRALASKSSVEMTFGLLGGLLGACFGVYRALRAARAEARSRTTDEGLAEEDLRAALEREAILKAKFRPGGGPVPDSTAIEDPGRLHEGNGR
jgi:hypothetical protein